MELETVTTEKCLEYLEAIRDGAESPELSEFIEACRKYARRTALTYYKQQAPHTPRLATISIDDFADVACQETTMRFMERSRLGKTYCHAHIKTIIYSLFEKVKLEVERDISGKGWGYIVDSVDSGMQGAANDGPEPDGEASSVGGPSTAEPAGLWWDPVFNELAVQESRERLHRSVEKLTSKKQRRVILMDLDDIDDKFIAEYLNVTPQRVGELKRQAEEHLAKLMFRDRLLESLPYLCSLVEHVHESIGVCYTKGLLQATIKEREENVLVRGLGAGSKRTLKCGSKLAVETQDAELDELISEMWEKRNLQGVRDTEYGHGWKNLSTVQKRVLLLALHCDRPVIVERHRVRLRKEDKVSRDHR